MKWIFGRSVQANVKIDTTPFFLMGVEIGGSAFASVASYGFGQSGQAKRVPGLSAHPDLPRTSKAPSPLRPADADQDSVSSNRFVGVNQENVHNNNSTQINKKGK